LKYGRVDDFLALSDRWEKVRDLEFHAAQNDMYVLEDDDKVETGIHTG
jgi:hypothetical protein